jgi:hypothetical protein
MYMAIYDETGTVDTIPALPGQQVCMYLNIFPDIPLGGIDVLLCYDQTGLQFIGTMAMGDLADWEYFTYRTAVDGNCGSSACPTGYIRLVAIADLDNGPTVRRMHHLVSKVPWLSCASRSRLTGTSSASASRSTSVPSIAVITRWRRKTVTSLISRSMVRIVRIRNRVTAT